MDAASFPIDLTAFVPVPLDPAQPELTAAQRQQLQANIALCRDAIVFFTATGAAKGVGGHTGGPYDIVPEVLIADGFFRGQPERFVPICYDEAGHRVAIQYLLAVLHGYLPAERLLHYREAGSQLPGHPEMGHTPGVHFSSGRLGHMWATANGIALAHPDRVVFLFGSDGSQQEGNDAEAARLAVARGLHVKLVIDDNDVTIAGHPSQYLRGFDVGKTLAGHGLHVTECDGEDLDALYRRMCLAVATPGPVAVVAKRAMSVGIEGIEGTPKGHDVVPVANAVAYLQRHGHDAAVAYLQGLEALPADRAYLGSDANSRGSNRTVFGEAVVEVLDGLPPAERARRVLVVDADLAGSTGIAAIQRAHPEVYVHGGVMERGGVSAAAGFGMPDPRTTVHSDRHGVFATFAAFLEMCVSEFTMARLNRANLLCHFSHSGIDDMADNTCHFGLNNFFGDNGLEEDETTRLYVPADQHQMRAVVKRVFFQPGLRFVFSTRSKVPDVLDADGRTLYAAERYTFEPDRDEVVREGSAGWVVSFGDALYRALDAVERLRRDGLDVGVINKPTLNVPDEAMLARVGAAPFVLVVEALNRKTGLGVRYGTWLLERGYAPRFAHLGTHREGVGGLWQQYYHQGLDSESIAAKLRELAGA